MQCEDDEILVVKGVCVCLLRVPRDQSTSLFDVGEVPCWSRGFLTRRRRSLSKAKKGREPNKKRPCDS